MNTRGFEYATTQQVVYDWLRRRGGSCTPGELADALFDQLNPDAPPCLAVRDGKRREDNRRKVWARAVLRRMAQRGMVYANKKGKRNGPTPTTWTLTTPESRLIY